MPALPKFLNRYTTLPALFDILCNRHIALLSPETWTDRNDAYYLESYRDNKALQTVLAVCFSMQTETFHHWRIFAEGSAGVCIEFRPEKLINEIREKSGFRFGPVQYSFVGDVRKKRPPVENWPFLKRKPYKDEAEFRIVYESTSQTVQVKHIPIEVTAIRKITLSPWIHNSLRKSVVQVIRDIKSCSKLDIRCSNLLDTTGWKMAIE